MLIAHLADLHLGYRAYHRLGRGGVNQREQDVSEALGRVVDQVVDAAPELVLVAGDVFHTVRPSNGAIMAAFRQFMRLRRGLPTTPVVMIAGNHDSPRSIDTGSILRLLGEIPDVHVVDDEARAVRLSEIDASVLCLPHAALVGDTPPEIEPDPLAAANVLMLHGTVAGTGVDEQLLRLVEYGGAHIDRAALREDAWDYVALGHYHNATRIAGHVWYAGATERTATNIWAEADTRKGWVLYDTETRQGEFREVRTREVVDLPRFSARRPGSSDEWLTPEELDGRIRDAVAELPGGVEGKIVRLVVTDIPRDLFRQLDHRAIRQLKAEALHFQLDARRPEVRRPPTAEAERRRTLEEEVEWFLKSWHPTMPGIDRERLLVLGSEYLADAGAGSGSGPQSGSSGDSGDPGGARGDHAENAEVGAAGGVAEAGENAEGSEGGEAAEDPGDTKAPPTTSTTTSTTASTNTKPEPPANAAEAGNADLADDAGGRP